MNRQPKGIPVGGEFAAHDRADADVELAAGPDDDQEVQPRFTVAQSTLAELIHRVEKANKRLARAGVEERFTYEVEDGIAHTDGGHTVAVAHVTLSRPRIGIDGYTVAGVYDFTPDGDPVPAYREDASVVAPDTPHCEQCGTTRRRERIFVIRDADGSQKVVGRSCLAPYLGIKPEGLWALEFDPNATGEERDTDDEFTFGDGLRANRSDIVYPVEDFVATAVAISDANGGFVSRAKGTRENPATVDRIGGSVLPASECSAETREKTKAILDWVASIDPDTDDEYLGKLHQLLVGSTGVQGRFVKGKHAAVAASAVGAYERALADAAREQVQKQAKAAYTPGFLAPEGQKVTGISATVERVTHGESHFGYRPTSWTRVAMITDDGHRTVWFASSYKSFEVGAKVTVSGTVKRHEQDDYDGETTDVTMLTRAKLIDAETGETLG